MLNVINLMFYVIYMMLIWLSHRWFFQNSLSFTVVAGGACRESVAVMDRWRHRAAVAGVYRWQHRTALEWTARL